MRLRDQIASRLINRTIYRCIECRRATTEPVLAMCHRCHMKNWRIRKKCKPEANATLINAMVEDSLEVGAIFPVGDTGHPNEEEMGE